MDLPPSYEETFSKVDFRVDPEFDQSVSNARSLTILSKSNFKFDSFEADFKIVYRMPRSLAVIILIKN